MNEAVVCEKLKCLIIEDNYFAADIMSIFFQQHNIESEVAENGEIGLQKYFQNPEAFQIIFCDLQMPVMDGHEVVKRIRESGLPTAKTIPIVAMSGSITSDVVAEESFCCFLKKPFELHFLLDTIDEALKRTI